MGGLVCPLTGVGNDLVVPPIHDGDPGPGQRVRQSLDGYRDTQIHHLLYLPVNWQKGGSYPVIMEYPGNRSGPHSGRVDSCMLGYGVSGGNGVIWVSLPFVGKKRLKPALNWWGDAEATVEYCKQAVAEVCKTYGGNHTTRGKLK